jgi:dephospho-CoA kinase
VGITGHFATGKDTVAEYLRDKHGYMVLSMYEPLKKLARDIYGEPTRSRVYELGKSLSEAFGRDLFIWWCEHSLRDFRGRIVVKDARFANEVLWLSGVAKLIIYLESTPEVAFERVKRRGRPGDPADLAELEVMWADEGEVDSIRDLPINNLVVVANNGDLDSLYGKVDDALRRWVGEG